jgi:hypothetical protein
MSEQKIIELVNRWFAKKRSLDKSDAIALARLIADQTKSDLKFNL